MKVKDIRSSKNFKCTSCGTLVLAGETYFSVVTVNNKRTDIQKLCVECAREKDLDKRGSKK